MVRVYSKVRFAFSTIFTPQKYYLKTNQNKANKLK